MKDLNMFISTIYIVDLYSNLTIKNLNISNINSV